MLPAFICRNDPNIRQVRIGNPSSGQKLPDHLMLLKASRQLNLIDAIPVMLCQIVHVDMIPVQHPLALQGHIQDHIM